MKPKANRVEPLIDKCQTPGYALDPLMPYLDKKWIVWESAVGEGYLMRGLLERGIEHVTFSDIGTGYDFFTWEPPRWDIQVTNPPYSIKYQWLEHSYTLGKPFALLMPVEMMGAAKAQVLFKRYGITVMLLSRRVNFKMPNKGWNGGGAQFPVAWYIWTRQNTESRIVYGDINVP